MKNTAMFLIVILVVVVGVIVAASSAFVVKEGQQAIVTQFGKPVGDAITEPGLKFKTPFIQDVRYLDKRILWWDGDPNQLQTKKKVPINVDTTARWRISDPLKFLQSVQSELGARSRLDAILDSATRNVIAANNLVDAVRTTDDIEADIQRRKENPDEEGIEEVTGEIEKVTVGREKLSQLIAQMAEQELKDLGITLVDVQLRQISYEGSAERKVFARMRSERERIANKLRSEGQGEAEKILGRVSKDLQEIESTAYKEVQTILGTAEATAIDIYARAYGQDPDFYDFIRTLEAYEKSLDEDTHFILSTGSEFLQLFKTGIPRDG